MLPQANGNMFSVHLPVAHPVPDAAIAAVDDDIGAIVDGDLPGPFDGLILVSENGGVALIAFAFHRPAAIGVGHHVLMIGAATPTQAGILQNDAQDLFQQVGPE